MDACRTHLDACHLLRFLEPEARAELAAVARPIVAPAGRRFFDQGDPSPGLHVVGRGRARVFKSAASGKEHTLRLPGPGDTFAEVAALGGFPVPASAEAVTDCEVVLVPTDALSAFLDARPSASRRLLMGLCGRVRHVVGLMEDIVLRDALGRLARYVQTHGEGEGSEVPLPTPRRLLATHLNLTPETLSRCLRRLEDLGAVVATEAGVRIADVACLDGAADGLLPLT